MEKLITFQRWKKEYKDKMEIAEKYYGMLSVLNNLHLTEREIQLIAYSAIKGNISNANVRNEFCKIYNTSYPTISNMVSRLKKLGVVVKEENKKIKVNPKLVIDFSNDVVIQITLKTNG
mgnify:CR=1 FL=1